MMALCVVLSGPRRGVAPSQVGKYGFIEIAYLVIFRIDGALLASHRNDCMD